MNTPRIIMIHGNGGGTAEGFWFPQVKTGLETNGFEVIAQTMPDNVLARANRWLPFIENVLKADENSFLIGWSSGAVAAMRYAETHKIFGSALIGACYTDLGERSEKISGYYDEPWNWNAIRDNQEVIIQFASSDDPYIPIEEARHIHTSLQTDYYEDTDKGHYMNSTFPELVSVLTSKLSQQGAVYE